LLRVADLTIHFSGPSGEVRPVRGVNINLVESDALAIVGPSGSGKSLTALSIIRLLPRNARVDGDVEFRGMNLLRLDENRMRELRGRQIAMIFEQPAACLNPIMTIGYQICEAVRRRFGGHTRGERDRVIDLLAETGIQNPQVRFSQFPHELSGGMQQRAMIAMALASKPDLLIADEPTAALDPKTRDQIIELLRTSAERLGMTLLLVTHDYFAARALCARALIMQEGEIVDETTSEEVLRRSQRPPRVSVSLLTPHEKVEPAGTHPLLEATKLTKRYFASRRVSSVTALDEVSVDIRQGETVAIVGESGSGKSTLARCLLRLTEPDAGQVTFLNMDWLGLSQRELRRHRPEMQAVFQDADGALAQRVRVRDLLLEPFIIQKRMERHPREHISTLLAAVHLGPELLDRFPREISGGQRQRVGIARALALNPKLVILDEPTASLDYVSKWRIVDLLNNFQRERGISYLLISHEPEVVSAMAHRVRRIVDGFLTAGVTAPTEPRP
jgi:microcin C transport system ATP-binding protein